MKVSTVRCRALLSTLSKAAQHQTCTDIPRRTIFPIVSSRGLVSPSEHQSNATAIHAQHAEEPTTTSLTMQGRWAYTVEIMVSKLFPGGFGWQAASCIAETHGHAADSVGFAAYTGIGDATGVFVGHMTYKILQKVFTDKQVSLTTELGAASWLGGAALMAGGSWQPLVNLFHDGLGLGFNATFAGVAAGCGGIFFTGLRLGRKILPWMPAGNSENARQDAGLALSIGGATGMFVATDMSFVMGSSDGFYALTNNVFGVLETDAALTGCIKAGAATFTGFGLLNAAQNVLPKGYNWMDGNNPYA